MRKATRAVILALLAFLSSVLIGVAAVITAAITVAATTALIVPGTGTPNANIVSDYMENAYDRYIYPSDQTLPLPANCTIANNCLQGVNYPASFWPLFFIGNWCPGAQCDKWNVSVATGVDHLDTQLQTALANLQPGDKVVIFGYSQGARVVSIEKENLGPNNPDKDNIEIVLIGNISRPNGGLWSRLSFLPTIPILDVSFGNPTPTYTADTGIKTTDISFEYDGVSDFPVYPLNLLAVANAIAGFQYVHGYYLVPNGNGPTDQLPWGYTPADIQGFVEDPNNPVKGDTTYVTIPAKSLPILQPFIDLGNATGTSAIVDPLLELVQPALKVLIDTGYDRTASPGDPITFRLIPRINPLTLAVDLVVAVGQGIHDATDGVPIVPTVTPPPTSSSSTVALNTSLKQSVDTPKIDAPVDNSLGSTQNKDPKSDPGTLSATDNGKRPVKNPFNLVELPKSSTTSTGTPATKPKDWKPGAVLQQITSGIKDAVDDLTKPHSSTTPGSETTPGGQTGNPQGANGPSAPSQAAA